ncbi:MAG TPA: calcium/sodium antiporter [Halanaerobiales bacterium]|nr:calcium/sodium antiporter [Halanaerobiales bacterium]
MEDIIRNYLLSVSTFYLLFIITLMLYTLSKGADIVVDEAVNLSINLGVSRVIIGATIISLGTTLPEASVSVLAAIKGNPDLALGNAIGSIIADTGLIIGLAALIGHLPVEESIVNRQGKIQLYSGILLAVLALPFISGGRINQYTGWIFIFLLIIYLYSSIKWARKSSVDTGTALPETVNQEKDCTVEKQAAGKDAALVQLLKLAAGITLVIVSSKVLIPTVEVTAGRLGISQSIIAATLVAFGTSLPELVTAITAVRKGHGELAVGNIIGADILNVLFVIGAAATVTPAGLLVPFYFYKLQIPAMLIILISFRFFSTRKKRAISSKEGLVLVSIYCIYLILSFTGV